MFVDSIFEKYIVLFRIMLHLPCINRARHLEHDDQESYGDLLP
jgi:hypothetical protein